MTEVGAWGSFRKLAAKRFVLETQVKLQKCRAFQGLSNSVRQVHKQTITLSVVIFKF
jgi:hypothetical protein